ncbi:hypothetical protein AB0C96_41105 [Streptomyces sp. NPDC048506]|uniref:hypothetical protein n=1 Tax=Streptomyces sp. NPDC048506 TaxID=3155028 RepID=UPI00342D4832
MPIPTVPESTKSSLAQKLTARARAAWPQLTGLDIHHRGQFAYVDGELAHRQSVKLMRLHCGGSASQWGFALYLASSDKQEDTILPTGSFAGTPEGALCPA